MKKSLLHVSAISISLAALFSFKTAQVNAAQPVLPQCVKQGNCQYTISTFVGQPGQAGSSNGTVKTASLNWPTAIAFDNLGNAYISSTGDSSIRKVDTNGNVTLVTQGWYAGALATDKDNNLYAYDCSHGRILKFPYQTTSPYAGAQIIAGNDAPGTPGYAQGALFNAGLGAGGAAGGWGGLIIDPKGHIIFPQNTEGTVHKLINTNGKWSRTMIAGTQGAPGFDENAANGSAAVGAKLNRSQQLALDASGNIYVADGQNVRVRKLTPVPGDATGTKYTISTYAGKGTEGFSGDGGPAVNAQFRMEMTGISLDAAGNLYISDSGNRLIRHVNAQTGIITSIAGTPGAGGFDLNGGKALGSKMGNNFRNGVDANGNVYIPDADNQVILKLTPIVPPVATPVVAPAVQPQPIVKPVATPVVVPAVQPQPIVKPEETPVIEPEEPQPIVQPEETPVIDPLEPQEEADQNSKSDEGETTE